ncbi:MAG: hypothetical protein ACI4EN_08670, partial [Butyrivibrio sp.]
MENGMKKMTRKQWGWAAALVTAAFSTAAGVFLIPGIYSAAVGTKTVNTGIYAAGIILCLLGMAVSAAFFIYRGNKNKKPYGSILAGVIVTGTAYTAAAALLSMLWGGIAVIIYNLMYSNFTIDRIKTVINITISVLSVAVIPVASVMFFRITDSGKIKDISKYPGKVAVSYVKTAILTVVLLGAGILTVGITEDFTSEKAALIIKTVIYTIMGAAALILAHRFSLNKPMNHRDRKQAES